MSVPVAFVGTIGFIGLVAPHLARLSVGEDQRAFLPASAIAGALHLGLIDVLVTDKFTAARLTA